MVEILLILDASSFTTEDDFELMKSLVKKMYQKLPMGTKAVRIALLTFSDFSSTQWTFTGGITSIDINKMTAIIDNIARSQSNFLKF